MRFGEGGRLVGLLCEPASASVIADSTPIVLIGNTGRSPHFGVGRFAVGLARSLAVAGIASFRFDFAGLGDSLGSGGQRDTLSPVFAEARSPDISAAIEALGRRGYRRFAIQGLCSGAYHAFHSALSDARVDRLILVNLPLFDWYPVRLVELPRYCLRRMSEADAWRCLLRGEIPVYRLVGALLGRVLDKLQSCAACPSTLSRYTAPYRSFKKLSCRGVQTLLLFAGGDAGLGPMQLAFGKFQQGVASIHGVQMRIQSDFDHALTARTMRQHAILLILDFLTKADPRLVSPPAAVPPQPSALPMWTERETELSEPLSR